MKKFIIPILITSALFMGCDEESEEGANGIHNQGQDCLVCHGIGGSEEPQLSSGATVFTKLNALNNDTSSYAKGYTIKLLLSDGKSVRFSSGLGDGNSKTSATLGGYDFTAQVVDSSGNVVNSSATNSHNSNRLACNSCHTSRGANNAPGRIINTKIQTSNDTSNQNNTNNSDNNTTSTRSFKDDVMPILESKCQACHSPSGSQSGSSLVVDDVASTYNDVKSLVNKKSDRFYNNIGHQSGTLLSTSSTEYKTVKAWITQGAKNN